MFWPGGSLKNARGCGAFLIETTEAAGRHGRPPGRALAGGFSRFKGLLRKRAGPGRRHIISH